MKIRILGSGTSSGVPRIGNDWGDCDPTEPRNRRTRASVLIETDAPFLAPVPHRGKTGEPAFVADTAEFLSKLRGEDIGVLAEATSANFRKLFAKTSAA